MVLRVIVYAVLIYGALRFLEWRSIYYPTDKIEYTPADAGLKYDEATFVTSDDVELQGWWIPNDDARATLIICYGNAQNMGNRIWMAKDLHSLGLNIFLFDYRGYGRSGGIPTEKGTYRDVRAAYEFVRMKHNDVDDPPVILYGRSLGGAVAMQCALEKPVRGFIVESAFASIPAMAREVYPWLPVGLIATYGYDNLAKAADLEVPLLVSASRGDTIVPYEQTRSIFEAAPQPKFWAELAGDHNETGWDRSPEYWKAIREFVDYALE